MQMKQFTKMMSFLILTAGIMAPGSLLAQKEKDKEKKEGEQIIITRKGKSDDKVVVEVVGDKVIVNGKELKDNEDGDVTVRRHKIKDVWLLAVATRLVHGVGMGIISKCLKWMKIRLCWAFQQNKPKRERKYKT